MRDVIRRAAFGLTMVLLVLVARGQTVDTDWAFPLLGRALFEDKAVHKVAPETWVYGYESVPIWGSQTISPPRVDALENGKIYAIVFIFDGGSWEDLMGQAHLHYGKYDERIVSPGDSELFIWRGDYVSLTMVAFEDENGIPLCMISSSFTNAADWLR